MNNYVVLNVHPAIRQDVLEGWLAASRAAASFLQPTDKVDAWVETIKSLERASKEVPAAGLLSAAAEAEIEITELMNEIVLAASKGAKMLSVSVMSDATIRVLHQSGFTVSVQENEWIVRWP